MEAGESRYPDGDTKISESNLHNFFSDAGDTIGDYSFKSDGLVIFSYYPGGYSYGHEEKQSQQQMKTIQGSWSMAGKKVTISWEKNSIFPKNNCASKRKIIRSSRCTISFEKRSIFLK